MTNTIPLQLLRDMFDAAVDAAQPDVCLAPHLPPKPKGRTVVVGAGKGAGAMARALEQAWDGPLEGVVVTRYGHAVPTERIEVLEAAHPVPDQAGVDASKRILNAVSNLTEDDLVLCLISGGGSALLSLPAEGITLEDKQAVTGELLACGATISEMNCLRKHLSAIKGGRLAMACQPARVVALMISDVPGDDLSSIASGATVPDPTTYADALDLIDKYNMKVPASVWDLLQKAPDETPKPGDARFGNVENILIATPQKSLEAAARVAGFAGFDPLILSDRIEGEAYDVALVHAAIAQQVVTHGQPVKRPAVILSGGETTVTLKRKDGCGGRNTEFLLSLATALNGLEGVYAIACDTDGIDGSEDNSGAIITPDTLVRGPDAKAHLAANTAYRYFENLGDLVITGPTLTNVNDFRAIVIAGDGHGTA